MSNCPKCHRPLNEGNSPNFEECHGGDLDDDGQCELSAIIYGLRADLETSKVEIVRLLCLLRCSKTPYRASWDEPFRVLVEEFPTALFGNFPRQAADFVVQEHKERVAAIEKERDHWEKLAKHNAHVGNETEDERFRLFLENKGLRDDKSALIQDINNRERAIRELSEENQQLRDLLKEAITGLENSQPVPTDTYRLNFKETEQAEASDLKERQAHYVLTGKLVDWLGTHDAPAT